ncbi:hypothetical protein PAE9249_02217 [Paenibacillus sp. CECT 9249]|uniref:LPXTG cell wall anchor domain-containing protein n=1 Tax=Paenibacillus sp. CECT 9249 TaxID=2845385 RepID=UPI001E651973|nr:LPXTG cell wall anchor domain-containing protein [Paenibacillus sp. CECT 9249]CAH0119710.1 hypothetical protein PAE9249_02217 [Paenibacillus sp. CECT 9249]
MQFKAIVQPGQAGKNIINIASVHADNVKTPDRPREDVQVYPRNPMIESEKFVTNTDVTKTTYEVGDIVSYTIRVRSVVSDTYLENLTITDHLPIGLEYVPGSLRVDGVSVTDAQDGDAGHSVTGQVYGSFGDVWDMNWHTLDFQAVILEGQGGRTIENTALVTGDNMEQPGEPTEKMVVEPEPPVEPPVDSTDPDGGDRGGGDGGSPDDNPWRSPVVESEKIAKDLNGGSIRVGDVIEYTIRMRNTVSNSQVTNLVISDFLPEELKYVTGSLKVDGQAVTDAVDGDQGSYVDGKVSGRFGTITDTDWHTIVFRAEVVSGEAGQTIRNTGEVTGDNLNHSDHPSEDIVIGDGSGSNPGVPGTPNNPEGENSDSAFPDSGLSDGSSGSGDSNLSGGSNVSDQYDASSDPANAESGIGHKLPNTATNMYSYLLAGCIILLAGLFLLRRKKA